MLKAKSLIGRPIVAMESGKKIDQVRDLVFDHQAGKLMALLVDEAGWFRAAKVIPFEQVRSVGDDAIMVTNESVVEAAKGDSHIAALLESKVNLIGLAVLTASGQKLGRVTDLLLDERSGMVQGYEASEGLFADLTSGRSVIPATDVKQIGEHSVIVPDSLMAQLREHPGGIVGAIHDTGRNISQSVQHTADQVKAGYQETADQVRQSVEQTGQTVRQEYQQASQQVRLGVAQITTNAGEPADVKGTASTPVSILEQVKSKVQEGLDDLKDATYEKQREFLVGKTAANDILTDLGEVLVHRGSVISAFTVERAQASGKLLELLGSVSLDDTPTGAQAHGLVGDLGREANDLLGRAKTWVEDKRQDLGEVVSLQDEEARIRRVLGRPVNRVILAPDDSVILQSGEIVTNAAIQTARERGVLDLLLDSVN